MNLFSLGAMSAPPMKKKLATRGFPQPSEMAMKQSEEIMIADKMMEDDEEERCDSAGI